MTIKLISGINNAAVLRVFGFFVWSWSDFKTKTKDQNGSSNVVFILLLKMKEKSLDKLAVIMYNYGKYYICNIKYQKDRGETDVSLSWK